MISRRSFIGAGSALLAVSGCATAGNGEKKEVMQGSYEEWFNRTVENAASIYEYVENLDQENPNLSYQFVYDFSPLLDESLLLGGYRLAYVLNTIFG